jgi:hypothetical protein
VVTAQGLWCLQGQQLHEKQNQYRDDRQNDFQYRQAAHLHQRDDGNSARCPRDAYVGSRPWSAIGVPVDDPGKSAEAHERDAHLDDQGWRWRSASLRLIGIRGLIRNHRRRRVTLRIERADRPRHAWIHVWEVLQLAAWLRHEIHGDGA